MKTDFTVSMSEVNNKKFRYEIKNGDGKTLSGSSLAVYGINLNGAKMPCAAIGGVHTPPEYRRNGFVRRLFGEMAVKADELSLPVSILHPFSFSYYRMFGYERVCDHRILEFPVTALDFVPRYPDFEECDENSKKELCMVYESFRNGRNLLPERDESFSFYFNEKDVCVYMSRDEKGNPDSYIIFDTDEEFFVNHMVGHRLIVKEMCFTSIASLNKLFGFMRMFEGQLKNVKILNCAMMPEVELRLRHYTDTKITVVPDVMARVNDVEAVLSLVKYPKEHGVFTVKVTEENAAFSEKTNAVVRVEYENETADIRRLQDGAEYDFCADIPAFTQLLFGYESYGYEVARYTSGTEFKNSADDFFRAFKNRPCGVFEHF